MTVAAELVKGYLAESPTFTERLNAASAAAVAGGSVPELLIGVLETIQTVKDCAACAARACTVLAMQNLEH